MAVVHAHPKTDWARPTVTLMEALPVARLDAGARANVHLDDRGEGGERCGRPGWIYVSRRSL